MYVNENSGLWDFDNINESWDGFYGEAVNEGAEEGKTEPIQRDLKARDIPGFKQTVNFNTKYAIEQHQKEQKKKSFIGKALSNLSRLGMSYDDKVIENMRALPADKGLLPKEKQIKYAQLYNAQSSKWKVKANEDKSFYEKDLGTKRDILRKLAVQPELEDILDTMTNECVVYDSNYTYFCEPYIDEKELAEFEPSWRQKTKDSISKSFSQFYKMLNLKNAGEDLFKRWLIEGILAWQIVYDNREKPKRIIQIIPIDPATITRKYANNKIYWVQFDGVQGQERTFLDSEIIYLSYQEEQCVSRLSYLERLIRPFNIYRIIEQAQIVWTVSNASYRLKFTIPVKGMTSTNGKQTLASAMNRYKEDIKFVSESGELTVNGQVNIPFQKEYWFPDSEAGTPDMETIGGEGPEIQDNEQLNYFRKQLYRVSKVPYSRFDQDSGETWFGSDATSVARTEIDFGRFVTRLRNKFAEILLKPIRIQVALDIPELQENVFLLQAIQLHWNSMNLFEEMMEMELMQKRVEFIQNMKESMVDMDQDGNEIKFFSSEFLVQKYLHLSSADLELNNKLKQEEIDKMNLAGGESEEDEEEML